MSSAEKPNAENAAQDNDSKLLAEAFGADARVLQAKALLADAARDHRGQITGPRPANPELARVQRADLERFAELRGGNLFYPYLGSGFGSGALVELADGSVKLDMICGIGVHYFGHGDEGLGAATELGQPGAHASASRPGDERGGAAGSLFSHHQRRDGQ